MTTVSNALVDTDMLGEQMAAFDQQKREQEQEQEQSAANQEAVVTAAGLS